jgi:hypothetical protein
MRVRNTPHTKESLIALTKPEGECLVWFGTRRTNGYGVTVFMGKQTTTHRVMYQLHTQQSVPLGMEVDHLCNNRACINPEHLQLVTHSENMRLSKNRRATCRAGHEWTEASTYLATIKRKGEGTRLQRYCRICRANTQRNMRATALNNKGGIIK